MASRTTTTTGNITPIRGWLVWLCCLPAVALGYFGYIHFSDGIAADAAVPVPVFMVAQLPLPKGAYVAAAEALARTNVRNGNARLVLAEARMRAGMAPQNLVDQTTAAVSRAPASPRGWTLLSEMSYPRAPRVAARALSESLLLSPYDYWLVGAQVADAARQWSFLDADARVDALAKARLLWEEPILRPGLKSVLDTSGGPALLTAALPEEERRALNRWISQHGEGNKP